MKGKQTFKFVVISHNPFQIHTHTHTHTQAKAARGGRGL
jgi:hypothetical protein